MADTRCANPEYQLDVDVMVLEYTLYYAIRTKLQALRAHALEYKTDYDTMITKLSKSGLESYKMNVSADQMVESFDLLIRLFQHQHPTYSHSKSTKFNLKILELLVLLNDYLLHSPASDRLRKERSFISEYRRRWLKLRIADTYDDKKDFSKYLPAQIHHQLEVSVDYVELNDCLARFMVVSAEIGAASGDINVRWYQLAGEFMLQSAAERTRQLPSYLRLYAQTPPEAGVYACECLAWGLIQPDPSDVMRRERPDADEWTRRHLRDQTSINQLFSQKPDPIHSRHEAGPSNKPRIQYVEDPDWTTLRTEILDEFSAFIHDCTANENTTSLKSPYNVILTAVRETYPLSTFLGSVYDFIEEAWGQNMGALNQKPVLVQIEEGELDGYDREEFRGFLDRVGLRVGGRGIIKWAR